MKKFSKHINETMVNPGNALLTTGVANHYTPVQNILTNIRNLFCSMLGVVGEIGEDGLSIKLSSSQFISQQKTNEILWRPMYNDVSYGTSSLYGYITAQGLRKVTTVLIGSYYVVYFSPDDIRAAKNPIAMEPDAIAATDDCCGDCCDDPCGCTHCCPCPCEAKESVYDEFEITHLNEDDDEDEKNEATESADILNIINNADKIVAAKQLDMVMSNKMTLPREYYFTSVKFKNGDEAVALRWRYNKQLPTGKSTENVRSLIHIFGNGANGVWVQDYAKDSIVQLPENVKEIIEQVLNVLGAQKTNDPAVYSLMGMGMPTDNTEEQETDDDDKKEETTEETPEKTDDKEKSSDSDNLL